MLKYDSGTKRGHVHGEAFMLMTYACKTCDHRETIWNSRDGVTPFGTSCPSCGGMLYHGDWQNDTYAPDHVLHNGQRFWRDGTPEEAEAIMRRRIEKCRGGPYEVDEVTAARLLKNARENSEGEFQKGWPMLSIAS